MKRLLVPGFALVATALANAHARAHGHLHAHAKKDYIEEKVSVTVVECWLGDHALPEDECNQGIKNGTLKWADDGTLVGHQTAKTTVYHTVPTSASSSDPKIVAPSVKPAAVPQVVQAYSNTGGGSGVNKEFPDGQLDCSTFPSDYGAVPLNWLNLGGWAGVQKPNAMGSSGYNDIMTVTKAQCKNGNCCLDDSFCSYACPEGYLRYQWPSLQGATGQSVGGLSCINGKLHLSNPSVKTLCAPGSSNINVYVKNTLDKNVAICRTNYPGDEKMSIPTDAQPGTTKKLACPDASTFYQWQGKGTSAQYYINMPGYSVEKACVWGNDGDDFGNFSPGNLGVGWSAGRAWVSITANHPTQMKAKLPYTIELVGGNSKCRYRDGQYCAGDNYNDCNSEGCTVSSSGGDITYVLS